MKFGEIYTYKNAEEAKQYIGKTGCFSDILKGITERPMQCVEGTLKKVDEEDSCPFNGEVRGGYQFFRPILEEEDDELMTNRQLAEWLAKGNGEFSYETSSLIFNCWQYSEGDEDEPVGDYFILRHWGDTEWSKPTKAIYEEDCLTNNAINKEDCK